MKLKNLKLKLSLIVIMTIALIPAVALAQDPNTPTPTMPLWVSLVALFVGYSTHAYQTGTLFGQKTFPKAWLPYVGAAAAFGTAFLAALPTSGTFSKFVLETAALAGLQGLVTMALGVAGHVAQTAHKSSRGLAASGTSSSSAPTSSPPPANDVSKSVPPAAAGLLLMALLGGLNWSCLSSAPLVTVTNANQAQVTTCENTATLHNGVVIGDFVLSGGTAGLAAAAAAVPDANTKTTLGVVGASVGGVAVIGAAIAELTNSNFQNSQCGALVGPLPTSKNPEVSK